MVSAAPRRLRSRRLRWSSLARRQSPRARAFRQGRRGFFLESKPTWRATWFAKDARSPGSVQPFPGGPRRRPPDRARRRRRPMGAGPDRRRPGGRGRGRDALDRGGAAAGLERRRLGAHMVIEDAPPGPARRAATEAAARAAALRGGETWPEELPMSLRDRSEWDRLVLEGVRASPRGQMARYGEVARRIGRAGAAQAVGGAVGRNPVGLLVPCHRVIAGDGTLGGYGVAAWGGDEAALEVKRERLAPRGCGSGEAVGGMTSREGPPWTTTARQRSRADPRIGPGRAGGRGEQGAGPGREDLGETLQGPAGTSSRHRRVSRMTCASARPPAADRGRREARRRPQAVRRQPGRGSESPYPAARRPRANDRASARPGLAGAARSVALSAVAARSAFASNGVIPGWAARMRAAAGDVRPAKLLPVTTIRVRHATPGTRTRPAAPGCRTRRLQLGTS